MEDQHQQNPTGDEDERIHGQVTRNSGVSGFLDGYSGPRARMVLDSSGDSIFGSIPADSNGPKLGILERIVSAFLSFGFLSAILISLVIVPIVMLGYGIYVTIERLGSKFFLRKQK